MNHNKLTLIIFFIAYPIYLDISIEEDVNLIAAIVTFYHCVPVLSDDIIPNFMFAGRAISMYFGYSSLSRCIVSVSSSTEVSDRMRVL